MSQLKPTLWLVCILQVTLGQGVTMSPAENAVLRHNLGNILLTTLRGKLDQLTQQLNSLTSKVDSIESRLDEKDNCTELRFTSHDNSIEEKFTSLGQKIDQQLNSLNSLTSKVDSIKTQLNEEENGTEGHCSSLGKKVGSIQDQLGVLSDKCVGTLNITAMLEPPTNNTCVNKCGPDSPKDCQDIQHSLTNPPSGVYTICVGSVYLRPLEVYCDMNTERGGWIVFQRRKDGSEDFYRGWHDYQIGFGDLTGEFWLGNDNLNAITGGNSRTCKLRVDMGDWRGQTRYAEYLHFSVSPQSQDYQLTLGPYSGNAGDSLIYHNGMAFSTKDRDNDRYVGLHCAQYRSGAWWYKSCLHSNLNGLYYINGISPSTKGIIWHHWHGGRYSLKWTEMKIRY